MSLKVNKNPNKNLFRKFYCFFLSAALPLLTTHKDIIEMVNLFQYCHFIKPPPKDGAGETIPFPQSKNTQKYLLFHVTYSCLSTLIFHIIHNFSKGESDFLHYLLSSMKKCEKLFSLSIFISEILLSLSILFQHYG